MVLCIINIPAVIFNIYMTSKGNNQTFQYLRNILRESQFPIAIFRRSMSPHPPRAKAYQWLVAWPGLWIHNDEYNNAAILLAKK